MIGPAMIGLAMIGLAMVGPAAGHAVNSAAA